MSISLFFMDLKKWLVIGLVLAMGVAAGVGFIHHEQRVVEQRVDRERLRRYEKQRVKELQAGQKKWDEFRP